MSSIERHCIKTDSKHIDEVLNSLRAFGANIVSVSYSKDVFLVMYKSDNYYSLDDCIGGR